MKMEDQKFKGYRGEEQYYHAEKISARPPFWRRYLWQIIALAALVLAAFFAFTTFVLLMRVPEPQTVGVWQGSFTYSPGEPYTGSFQATLRIPSLQAGVFTGTLYEPVYGNTTVNVSGTDGSSNQFNQDQLQYVTQRYGNGTGTFLVFTDPSDVQGDQVQLGCSYIAVVYSDGSLHGVWFYPGSTQPDGTFILNKVA